MIDIKTPKEVDILREGGKKLANILKKIKNQIKPDVTTQDLEKMACYLIKKEGGSPSFKGHAVDKNVFPTALCTSINSEVVHAPALPPRILKSGDIIGVDIGMKYKGLYTDMAVTATIGRTSTEAKKLIRVTQKALDLAIKQVKPNNSLLDIAKAIEDYALSQGFLVVRDLGGHGVGKAVWEKPFIPNYVDESMNLDKIILKPGMVIALEPMINAGSWEVKTLSDGFTVVTADNSLSAQFEHTMVVNKDGCEVLTKMQ